MIDVSLRRVSAKGCYKASESGRLWGPGVALSWLLELSLVPWRARSLSPRWMATAADLLFGGSARSEAACVSQRHAPSHRDTDSRGRGTAFNSPQTWHHQGSQKKHKYKSQVPKT